VRLRKTALTQSDKVDTDAVVLNLASMNCFLLNDTAAVLWDALDHFDDSEELVGLLSSAGVPDAARVIERYADDLIAAGLVEADPT
jgi:hypothetical protein